MNKKAAGKAIEQHAKDQETPAWMLAAAKAKQRWATGQEVSVKAYTTALQDVKKERIG